MSILSSLIRPLPLGAGLLAFALSFAASCGTSSACNATNCPRGCCSKDGTCQDGESVFACGRGGEACRECNTLSGQACVLNACVQWANFGTGGGTGTGGGSTGMGGGVVTGGGGGVGGGGGPGTGGGVATGGGGGISSGGGSGGGALVTGCDIAAQDCANGICLITRSGQMATGTACYPGCDLVNPSCPSGQKCGYAVTSGVASRMCIPAGSKFEGQACGPSFDDCASGLACIGGICERYCYSSADCTSGTGCTAPVAPPGTEETPITCQEQCDVLQQNCPTPTDACLPLSSTDSLCTPPGNAPDGAACNPAQPSCQKGSLCVGSTGNATCERMCNSLGGSPSCATGTCQPLSGLTGIGVCG